MRTTSLKELGSNLPIGILGADKKLRKDFKLKPFTLKQEKELAKRKGKQFNLVTALLSLLCEEVAGQNLTALKDDTERELFLSGLPASDILYLYLYLRVDSLGSEVRMDFRCPRCSEEFKFTGDLESLEVTVEDDATKLETEVTLKHGIPYRGQKRKTLKLRPVQWGIMDTIAQDPSSAAIALIQGTVAGVDGISDAEFSPIPESSLDEMTKRDLESLKEAVDKSSVGPKMEVETECPKCKLKQVEKIPWMYESFFGHSSL